MPSESILSATRPPFPTYLLPSLNFHSSFSPFRRRPSSTTSISSTASAYSAGSPTYHISPISSANTTPSSSPPNPGYFSPRYISGFATTVTAPEVPEEEGEVDFDTRIDRIQPDILKCSTCATDLAFASQIVSKGFTGRHGRAYLVSPPPNSSSTFRAATQADRDKDRSRDLINTRVGRPQNRQLVTGAHVVADISCVVCNSVVGWKYVDAKEAAQRYKIGKFILETRRVVVVKAWEDMDGPNGDRDRSGSTNLLGRVEEKIETREEEEIAFDSEDEDECEDLFAGVWDAEVVRKRRERRVGLRRKTDDFQTLL